MERVLKKTKYSDLFALCISLFSLRKLEVCDTLAILPGQGQHQRYSDGISEWNTNPNLKHLLIAAENTNEKHAFNLSTENLIHNFGLELKGTISLGVHANHTLDQAVWLCENLSKVESRGCFLYTAPFFLPRAFATVVKQALMHKIKIPIIPVPVHIAPHESVPETMVQGWDMFPGEVERIFKYQIKGDVASFSEIKSYIDWIHKNF